MSKKDYEAIAAILLRARTHGQRVELDAEAIGVIDTITHDLAEYFKSDSPRFDPRRFVAAAKGRTA